MSGLIPAGLTHTALLDVWLALLIQLVTDDHFSSVGVGKASSVRGRDHLRTEGRHASPHETHPCGGLETGFGLAAGVSVRWGWGGLGVEDWAG